MEMELKFTRRVILTIFLQYLKKSFDLTIFVVVITIILSGKWLTEPFKSIFGNYLLSNQKSNHPDGMY